MSPYLKRWRASKGQTGKVAKMPMIQQIQVPLAFEPGTDWKYGYSYEYVGLIVARLNKSTLGEYMRTNIWEPLSITSMTFNLNKHPTTKENIVHMCAREGLKEPVFNRSNRSNRKAVWCNHTILGTLSCLVISS
jgi:CubicO group peptidase (beta-lactamase class C family)